MEKVNLAEKFASFSERWAPKIVGTVDDYEVKIVKIAGDFIWHSHADADEMFLVVEGELRMDFPRSPGACGSGGDDRGAARRRAQTLRARRVQDDALGTARRREHR